MLRGAFPCACPSDFIRVPDTQRRCSAAGMFGFSLGCVKMEAASSSLPWLLVCLSKNLSWVLTWALNYLQIPQHAT